MQKYELKAVFIALKGRGRGELKVRRSVWCSMVGLVFCFVFVGDGLVLCDNMRRLCKKKVSHASFCPMTWDKLELLGGSEFAR